MVLIIGSHINRKSDDYTSIINSIKDEKKLGGNVMQIFLGNSIKTTLTNKFRISPSELKEIKAEIKESKVKIVIHSILTLNLCSPLERRYQWNVDNLVYDLELNNKIGGLGVVVHMGTMKSKNFDLTYKEAEDNYVKNIKGALKRTKKSLVIFETSCNQPNKVGGTIEEFAHLYKRFPPNLRKRIGICVDTAHIFSAGYKIETEEGMRDYWERFDKLIGIKNCTVIHLNDSKVECCSGVDRHETIGEGYIYGESKDSLKYLIGIAKKNSIPMVLETNSKYFKNEIKLVKDLAKKQKGGKKKDMKSKIIDIFEQMYEFHSKLGNEGNNKTPFRTMGYRKALNGLKGYKGKIYTSEDVRDISGFGEKFIEKVDEIINTGTLSILEEIKTNPKITAKQEFQNIMGIGPKIAQKIVNKHKIYSIKELKDAVKKGKVKLNDVQLQGIKYVKMLKKKIPRKELEKWEELVQKHLEKQNKGFRTCLVGSYRLGKKESGDIDLLVYGDKYENKPKFIEDFLEGFKDKIVFMISRGRSKIMMLVRMNKKSIVRHMDIVFIIKEELPWWLLYFGSDVTFARKIRALASKMGYKLNERGLFKKLGNGKFERINFSPKSEKEIFDYLNLEYIKPKNRLTY
jgi:apurinic endonuclease APN1